MPPDPLSSGKAIFTERPIRLLLVEDEEAHAVLIERTFQEQAPPVHLTVARNLFEARNHLHAFTPDLVITDIRLPDGSGIELLTQGIHRPPFPIIVMTSYGDENMAVEAMKAGALDYVVKSEATIIDMPHVTERALRQWHEITERQRAENELRTRAKQLVALSHLSYQILSGVGLDALMKEAADLIAQILNIRYIKILELLPKQRNFILRAATGGWSSRVGQIMPITDQDPLTNHVLASGEAAFIKDFEELRTGARFRGSPLLESHEQISGVSLPLRGRERCLGILWACSKQRWSLTKNDINFLQSAGNILAAAIERKEGETRMHKLQNDLLQASQLSILGEFGSTLAHEVNQPIAAIINYLRACQQMLTTGKEQVTQTIYELMDKAVAQAERAASIIHHLREFTRSGKLDRASEPLNTIVYDASRLALGEVAEKDIKINFNLSSQLPLVYIDKIQIQQVVFNLVRNAVEALAEAENKSITIKTLPTRSHAIEVQIQDTGPGIDPVLATQIFQQRFSTKDEGMGMGLSISCSIIHAHSGELWATKTPGGGATFHFTIPIATESSA